MWRGIYLMKLPGAARRTRVLLAWIVDYIMPPDSVQLKLSSSAGITQEHFEPGQDIFREGDVGDRIYIILSGEADVCAGPRLGKEVHCTRLRAGEFFGEMAVLNGSVRSSTVRCKTSMDALSLPKREFGLLTANLPELKTSFENVKEQRMERDEATDAAPPTMHGSRRLRRRSRRRCRRPSRSPKRRRTDERAGRDDTSRVDRRSRASDVAQGALLGCTPPSASTTANTAVGWKPMWLSAMISSFTSAVAS